MPDAANPTDDPDDARALARSAEALGDAVEAHVAVWASRCVMERWARWQPGAPPAEVVEAATTVGEQTRARVMPALRSLLGTDVDAQRTNPLALLRQAVELPTVALRDLGVPPVERDEQARRLFPDDDYDLVPASFADIDPAVHEPGVVWGAAKAHVILRRHRA